MIKKILLNKSRFVILLVFLFAFSGNVNSQTYTITGNRNSSDLACGTFTGRNIIDIGDGSASSLIMDNNLNLTTCSLAPIQLFVNNNANINFSLNNSDLRLPAGSSITFNGGTLYTGSASACSASDRIWIGGELIATCEGKAGVMSFEQLVQQGGYSPITVSASPSLICNSGSSIITALASGANSYKWYDAAGTQLLPTTNTFNTGTISSTTTYYVEAVYSTYKTVRKAVTVTVTNVSAATGTATQSFCASNNPTIANLAVTGTAIKWYAAPTGGSALATTTALVNGTHYYATQTLSGCESATRFDVTATVTNAAVPTGTAAQSFCASTNPTVANLAATGTAIKWYAVSTGGSALSTTTALVNGTHYYATQILSGCESAARFDVTATVINTTVPTGTATQSFCTSNNPTVANLAATGTAIKWYAVSTGGSALATTTALVNGAHYYATQTLSGCESSTRFDVTATVTNTTVPTGTATQSFCTSNNPTVANLVATGTGIKWYAASTGVSALAPTTVLVNGAHYYATQTLSGCESATRFDVMAIVTNTTAPSVGTLTHPTCATPTGSVVLNDLPASGTWTLTRSPGGVTTSGTGTSKTISGLAAGNYTYTVTNALGCISPDSANVGINTFVAEINTWRGVLLGWDKTTPPTAEQKIVFDGGTDLYTLNSDIVACSCQAKSDVNIILGHTLTLTNELEVVSPANVVFEDGTSLVQIKNVVNTGDIEYNRDYKSLNTDYTYWSSPVSPQKILDFSPDTMDGMMYSYDSSIDNWRQEYLSTSMDAGVGYIVRGPEPSGFPLPPPSTTPQPFTATFKGEPNNGDVTIPVPNNIKFGLATTDPDFGVSYLLGNPYPSAINADTFLTVNVDVLEGTLYFWTHNTQIGTAVSDPGTGVYAYSGDDYASYNTTGGVGIGNFENGFEEIANKPTGKIAAGQGFFATAKAPGTVTFTNAMRRDISGNPYNNSQFFKTKNPNKSSKPIEKNRIWLNLTNTQGAFKQTLIGYVTDATNDFDSRFDGESFDGNEFVDFYSVNQDKNLVIQGRALPFDENDEVPLGFRTTINGAFTIKIDQVDGLLTNQAVFIEDKLTNTVFDLKSGNYTFNTVAGTFNDRFILRYNENNSSKTLETANFDSLEKTVLVSNKNKQIKIDSSIEMIDKVAIYDLLGRQIYQKTNVNSNELSISNLVSSRQMLMVKTVLQNGETVTKKIIY